MPRIAAALGVLATVAFCIGFNIQRYPVVWQSLAATPHPQNGSSRSATVMEPLEAIASAIRPATGKTAAEAKGLPQPIPLPQVAGPPRPIPAPDPARSLASDEPVPDYEMVAGPAEKYAGPAERPKPSATEKPKAQPAARAQTVEAKKSKPADSSKAKPNPAANSKSPDKPKPLATDKNKPQPDKARLQAQKAKPAPADKAQAQADKTQPPKAKAVAAAKPKTQPPIEPSAPVARVVERPLVPVRRGEYVVAAQAQPGWNTSRSPWSTPATPDRSLRRLPPVEPGQVSAANPFGPLNGRFPFYPTTGW